MCAQALAGMLFCAVEGRRLNLRLAVLCCAWAWREKGKKKKRSEASLDLRERYCQELLQTPLQP